jgi:hypothetical protein
MSKLKVDDIVVDINESSYQDGQLGAGHPSEEYRKKWVSQMRCAVADEILKEMEANNDPWRNHTGVVSDYISKNTEPSGDNDE